MNICLSKLPWFYYNDIWATGFIRENNKYLKQNDLLAYFSEVDSLEVFEKKLLLANGQFSVIIKRADQIWAATDRLRNFPLFYTEFNGDFIISDDCYNLADLLPKRSFNNKAVDCFLSAGFTVNSLTLFEGIFQIEAGEFVTGGNFLTRKFYYRSTDGGIVRNDFISSANILEKIFAEVFRNHFEALRDKFIAIPLSGGFDSRLVASMCAIYHPQNVLCYTYGRKDNREVSAAKEVACRLGLNWINIVYDSEVIKGYIDDHEFKEYYEYASGLSSMFYMQDYFAVKYLKSYNIVPENTVFIPGFSGDSLAGSFFNPSFKKHNNTKKISLQILNDKFILINLEKRKQENIRMLIEEMIGSSSNVSWKSYEDWEIKEIHSKFIINSGKVFTFFGYEYILPLFDKQLIDFFTSLPFEFKLNKKLYDYVLKGRIFSKFNLNLPVELNPAPAHRSMQRLREKIKRFVPASIINSLIDLKSPILYDKITSVMCEELKEENFIQPRQANYYNSYITQWYLKKTREKFNLDY